MYSHPIKIDQFVPEVGLIQENTAEIDTSNQL